MTDLLRPALTLFALLTLLTGVAYPAAITGLALVFFPEQASGSVIVVDGQARGSRLIGQNFDAPEYFWGRLSATGPSPYTPYNAETLTGSSGSNLGPLAQTLAENAQARIDALRAADPGNDAPIPVDLVTASGSGLDPHISPAAAEYQVGRVARARGLDERQVLALVSAHTETPQLGLLGTTRVNVLELNLALDALGR